MNDARPDHLTWRHWVVTLVVIAAMGTVVFRLYNLQVVDHELYLAQAERTRLGDVEVAAPRGPITDATGYPIAVSVDTWDIYIDRYLWRNHDRASTAAIALGAFLQLDANGLMADGIAADIGDILVRRDISYEDGLALNDLDLWGVRTIPSAVRIYTEGDLANQIIGYVGIDNVGLWGIEADFDHILRGQPGGTASELGADGRPIAFGANSEDRAVRGGEVQLTIDRFIQAIIERQLDIALEEFDAVSGLHPRHGPAHRSDPRHGVAPRDLNNWWPRRPELL